VGADIASGSTLVVTYGGGPSGATVPTHPRRYAFTASIAGASDQRPVAVVPPPIIVVEAPSSGCRADADPEGVGARVLALPNGIARTNLHNTSQSTGAVRQCYSPSRGSTTSISLTSVTPVGHGPLGYLEVAYGYDAYGQPFCRNCRSEPFPMRVADLGAAPHDFWVTTRYALSVPSPDWLPFDFIYDFWLERNPSEGVAPQSGDVELLVFLYEQDMATCLDEPTAPAMFSTPAVFDGRPVLSTWRVCQIRGGTDATPIAFFLDTPSAARVGKVSLRIADFVQQAAAHLDADLTGHVLMGVELGGEFDQCEPSGCEVSGPSWDFVISELSVHSSSAAIPIVFTK